METETKTAVITWFEIPSVDFDRAVRFYESVTGHALQRENFGGTHMGIFPHAGEQVSGAIMEPGALKPSTDGLNVYLWIEYGLDAALARAREGGARIEQQPLEIPDVGWIAHIIDTEGNRIGLHANRR